MTVDGGATMTQTTCCAYVWTVNKISDTRYVAPLGGAETLNPFPAAVAPEQPGLWYHHCISLIYQ
eukprot:scaffold16710_cov38-Phaeocystis_antarctica.AAC.1